MIRVERQPEPPECDAKVRKPGQRWLAENPGSKSFPPYWRQVTVDVEAAFQERCAYTAMCPMTPATVDHFVSLDEDRTKAYEWENYRYAVGWINSSKSALRSEQILDPCEIGDDWFEVVLPGCELRVTEACPAELRERALFMLRRLSLNHGRKVLQYRKRWYELALKGLPLAEIDALAPLVARAIRKQQALQERGVSDGAAPETPGSE